MKIENYLMIIRFIGLFIGIISIILACVWFSWRLALVIFLALMGNNASKITV